MAIALIQAKYGNTDTTVYDTPTVQGNLLIATALRFSVTNRPPTPTDWTRAGEGHVGAGGYSIAIYFYPNNPGGITTVSCQNSAISISEFSGISHVTVDGFGSAFDSSVIPTISVSTSTPTTATNELGIIATTNYQQGAVGPYTPAPDWYDLASEAAPTSRFLSMWSETDYMGIVTGGGELAAGCQWQAFICTFKYQAPDNAIPPVVNFGSA